jgi:hypothetical protein
MNPTVTAIVVVAVIVLAAVIVFAIVKRRSVRLRSRFGPEYDRAVRETGSKYRAEAKLERLEQRVHKLDIRTLHLDERNRFREQWTAIQARFVDNPSLALQQADEIVREVMTAVGYPLSRFEDDAAQLSVDHPTVVANYRKGHEIALQQAHGRASTEEVRQGLIHYRTLFQELVGERVPTGVAAGAHRF